MKPSRAVAEAHAPTIVEADDETRAKWRALDFFASPPWACRAGAELVRRIDPMAEDAWEPACGDGIMAECMRETFSGVHATDIHPQGYGLTLDFLAPTTCSYGVNWVMTNPPFGKAVEFLEKGLEVATRGVALLCRLAFLESVDRYAPLYTGRHPLAVLAPFSERVPMQLGPWNPKCSTATAYAWFIFLKERRSQDPVIWPIGPGTRARLSRPDDVRRFCAPSDAPLLP